jgi:hypothetical protein
VEIVDPDDEAKHRHAWLEWIGLQDPPPTADTWVPVVKGLPLDDPKARSSTLGARLVRELSSAGIEAQQRLYEFYDVKPGVIMPGTGMVKCVAVGVHERDLPRAVEVAETVREKLKDAPSETLDPLAASDDELARQALEAGPAPPD